MSKAIDTHRLWAWKSETDRMNYQHSLWVDSFGYLLHPSIVASLPASPVVADAGTGTGIFLTDLAAEQPSSASFHGFDIGDSCFPSAASLPQNVSFSLHDAKQAWPAEYHGKFDVVFLRFVLSGLHDEHEWSTVARNVLQLLKPGGAIQWCEIDSPRMKILRDAPGAGTENCNLVLNYIKSISQKKDRFEVSGLRKTFQDVGFEATEEDWVSSDAKPQTRHDYLLKSLDLWRNILKASSGPGSAHTRTEAEVDAIMAAIVDEVHSGAYWRVDVVQVVGFKPKL